MRRLCHRLEGKKAKLGGHGLATRFSDAANDQYVGRGFRAAALSLQNEQLVLDPENISVAGNYGGCERGCCQEVLLPAGCKSKGVQDLRW